MFLETYWPYKKVKQVDNTAQAEAKEVSEYVYKQLYHLRGRALQLSGDINDVLRDVNWRYFGHRLYSIQKEFWTSAHGVAILALVIIISLFFYVWWRPQGLILNEDDYIASNASSSFSTENKAGSTVLNKVLSYLQKHRMFFPKLNFVFVQYVVDGRAADTSGARKRAPQRAARGGGLGCGSWSDNDNMHSSYYAEVQPPARYGRNRYPYQLIAPDGRVVDMAPPPNGPLGAPGYLYGPTKQKNQRNINAEANTDFNDPNRGYNEEPQDQRRPGRRTKRRSSSSGGPQPYVLESIAEEKEDEGRDLAKGWHQIYTPDHNNNFMPLTPPALRTKGQLYESQQQNVNRLNRQQHQQQQQQQFPQTSQSSNGTYMWGHPSYYEPIWLYRNNQTKYVNRGTSTNTDAHKTKPSNAYTDYTYEEVCHTTFRDRMPIFWRSKNSQSTLGSASASTGPNSGTTQPEISSKNGNINNNGRSGNSKYDYDLQEDDDDYSNYDWSSVATSSLGSTTSISTGGLSAGSTAATSVHSNAQLMNRADKHERKDATVESRLQFGRRQPAGVVNPSGKFSGHDDKKDSLLPNAAASDPKDIIQGSQLSSGESVLSTSVGPMKRILHKTWSRISK